MKGDYHIHSIYSSGDILKFDSCYSPNQIVKYAKKLGFEWIGFTEHNTLKGLNAWIRAGKKYELVIIPGVEVTFKTGRKFWFWDEQYHAIALGIEEFQKSKSLEEFCDWVREQAGLTVAPHCFSIAGMKERAKLVDAIEIFNSQANPLANLRARIFCEKENKIALAGSDSHSLKTLGKVLLEVNSRNDKDSIIQALRKGKVEIVKKEYNTISQTYEILREKYLKNYRDALNYLTQRENWERILGKALLDSGIRNERKAKLIYTLVYLGMECEDFLYHSFGLIKSFV